MSKWEKLESDCFKKIVHDYGDFATILPHGKSDSTRPDIEVVLKSGETFYIEVKSRNAQCCQFVLFPDDKSKNFIFSDRNKTPKSDACSKIIDHMNKSYSRYHKPTQNGIDIDIEKDILYDFVNEYYSSKLVKYFMTQDKNKNYIIFPASNFKNYFDITSCYRRKKSGSSEPGKTHIPEIMDGLIDYSINGTVDIVEIDKPRCMLTTDNNNLHKERLICTDYTYELKNNEHSKQVIPPNILSYIYEIRKLSNTNNPNVICQLEFKNVQQDFDDLNDFKTNFNVG